jgi:Holliday junction resolvase
MSSASKGRTHEHDVRKMLEANGYAVVRGAGSKGKFDCADGVVKPDLIASKRGTSNRYEIQVLLLQCKVRAA